PNLSCLPAAGAGAAATDQRRATVVQHAEQDQPPAALVVPVAHDLIVAVAAFAAGAAERMLLLGSARQIRKPLHAGELRQHVVGSGQEVVGRALLQNDVVKLRAVLYLHGVALIGQELDRSRDAQRV